MVGVHGAGLVGGVASQGFNGGEGKGAVDAACGVGAAWIGVRAMMSTNTRVKNCIVDF